MEVAHDKTALARLFSRDHKVIARQFLWLGLIMLAVGGLLSMVIRWHLAHPGAEVPLYGVVSPAAYTTLFTQHGSIMIFYAVTPILIGAFGNFCIPLMIGARDMSFPTLNMLSFWTQLVSTLVLAASWIAPGGSARAGWTAYPPLSTAVGTPGVGPSLWTLALILAGASTTMGAVNYITTVLRERAPGMTFLRMPLTVWGLWLTSILNALFVPVLGIAMLLLLCDRVFSTRFFVAGAFDRSGGDPLLYQHLFWIFGHPEVYILILPVWGVVSDLFSFFARKPAYGYRSTVISMIAVTVLSGLVYGHHMYVTSMTPLLGRAFMVLTIIISAPAMLIFLNWVLTLWRGAVRLTVPMLFALGVLFVFGSGGLSGLFLADIPQDVYLHDTFFVVGHFHLIMAAAVFLGSFAAIYFWFPKMFGRAMSARLGQLHFWLSFVPLIVVFFGMLVIGNAGMQRRLYDPSEYETFRPLARWNRGLSQVAYLLLFGQIFFVWNFFASLLRGAPAGQNPWQVGTLEWTLATSPPGEHNFDDIPTVLHGPHEFSHPDVRGKDWLGQAEPLPPREVRRVTTARARTTTSVGMAVFLGGWAMTFAALLFVWAELRFNAASWPPDGEARAPLFFPALATASMLLSSAAIWCNRAFLGTLIGALFLIVQCAGLFALAQKGVTPSSGRYGSLLYTITAFHALHVLVGLAGLVLARAAARPWRAFWHFVGAVWLVLFVALYLCGCTTEHPFSQPLILPARTVPASTLNRGRDVYQQQCRPCHGEHGDGHGLSAPGLRPPPRDFSQGLFKFGHVRTPELPPDDELARIVRLGLLGTAMLPWDVPDLEFDALLQYLKTFSPSWKRDRAGVPVEVSPDPFGEARAAEAIERGERVFREKAQCKSCHESRELKSTEYCLAWKPGWKTLDDRECERPVRELPPDLARDPLRTIHRGSELVDLYRIIGSGITGALMPPWKGVLSEEDLWAVAYYVRSLRR